MTDFWYFVKIMTSRRLATVMALLFAVVSAVGLGVGLLSLGPILAQVLDPEKGRSLRVMAEEVNASGGFWQVPDWLVSILPTDLFQGCHADRHQSFDSDRTGCRRELHASVSLADTGHPGRRGKQEGGCSRECWHFHLERSSPMARVNTSPA